MAEALVEEGAVPVPDGWSSGVAAERRQARRRLSDAVRQAWRREMARRPSAASVQQRRQTMPAERDVFVLDPAPAPAPAAQPRPGGSGQIERIRRLLDKESGRHVDPEPAPVADEDEDDARLRRVMEERSGRRR